jgi:response regulator RpfG family c-di-GMP phosphodiesterase/serine/threonine protein kinase
MDLLGRPSRPLELNGHRLPKEHKKYGSNGHLTRADTLLSELLATSLIPVEDWEKLPATTQDRLRACADDADTLLPLLIKAGMLTEYQAARVAAGNTFGLVLGNYRLLDRIGAGGMGVVFKAEHKYMRRLAAIKVLPLSADQNPLLLQRFYTEMRAVAQLQHPNIVCAFDAGRVDKPDPYGQSLHYFVMEYVQGYDLEQLVEAQGPLAPVQACDLIHQTACALGEADKHQLVHRDIKPSNILVTAEQQAKLLDFGLALCYDHRLTDPGTVLGTLDFLAPEQAKDASSVDIRADIYSLGGTLFWCLTGRIPFPSRGNMVQDLTDRLNQPPPSVRGLRPEVSFELDAVVQKMMATRPDDRFETPAAVQKALLPFLKPESPEHLLFSAAVAPTLPRPTQADGSFGRTQVIPAEGRLHQVLVVDDEDGIRNFCRFTLQSERLQCSEAVDGAAALAAIESKQFDLVLLDVSMPRMTGPELVKKVRQKPAYANLKIILFSGYQTPDELASLMASGVDDCLAKPFSIVQLRSRVQAALRLKDAQDRSDWLNQHLIAANLELERNLTARDSDLIAARNALVMALAQLVEYRETESPIHLLRLQRFCRVLAEEAAATAGFGEKIDSGFLQLLECCAPLHDIGKVALPDHILLKPGKLEAEERLLMQTHTTIGADILRRVAGQNGPALAFLTMAVDIARHHHERYDGHGYPDRLAGADIPLSARIVTVADVYDALRTSRKWKPALSHAAACQVMTDISTGQFDPILIEAFQCCAPKWEKIHRELTD